MAINFKKGPALTLGQTDKVAPVDAGSGIIAGNVVRIHATTGKATLGSSASTSTSDLLGFAINTATDGDVLESGKLGVFLLDGSSVVELDSACVTGTINNSTFNNGAPVAAGTDGKVKAASGSDRVIGYVEGIRSLPTIVTVNGVKVQGTTSFLGIKLAA